MARRLKKPKTPMHISFCTTCCNRAYQLEETFAHNLEVIRRHPGVEWVILDYNSRDDLHPFMLENLPRCPPRVVYARDTSGRPWHLSLAKNIAHRQATGAVLVNLDCDNFIADAVEVIGETLVGGVGMVHLWSGTFLDGTHGRIALRRQPFYQLGGYDESFEPMGYQDSDLLHRAQASGVRVVRRPSRPGTAIRNSKRDSVKHCSGLGSRDWEDLNERNGRLSQANIAAGRLVANVDRPWGQAQLELRQGTAGQAGTGRGGNFPVSAIQHSSNTEQ